MSLAIDIDRVIEVLLSDGWHQVLNNSFELDSYEYLYYPPADPHEVHRGWVEPLVRLGGGEEKASGIPATGATWTEMAHEQEVNMYCPLNSILAVRELPRKKKLEGNGKLKLKREVESAAEGARV